MRGFDRRLVEPRARATTETPSFAAGHGSAGWVRTWRVAIVASLIPMAGCSEDSAGRMPEPLPLRLVPQQHDPSWVVRHQLLFQYLEEELEIPVDHVPAVDCPEPSETLHKGGVDVALFGGVGFVAARRYSRAVPLVMRDIDRRSTTSFVVRSGEGLGAVDRLTGSRFAFAASAPTSGQVMSRSFLASRGTGPGGLFSEPGFTGSRDGAVVLVAPREADVAAVGTPPLERRFDSGRYDRDSLQVAAVPPQCPDCVRVAAPGVPEELRVRWVRAFLDLRPEDAQTGPTPELLDSHGHVAVRVLDFAPLEALVDRHGLRVNPAPGA